MATRFKMGKVQPGAYKAMEALDNFIANTSVEGGFQELIRIRASQINGCAYCVNSHSQDAVKLGIPWQKLQLISVWHEAQNIFSEEEQLLFQLTEEISLIHNEGLTDATYAKAIKIFGEEKLAEIMMVIITINAWNRIGVGLKMKPELVF